MNTINNDCQSPSKLGYVPALDGLRAIAVLLVMLAHANFQLGENGGNIGVDMFFALSGFLITTLLLEEHHKTGTISLRNFYIRRTFRLFPASYVMLLVVFIYALYFAEIDKKQLIMKEVYASGTYLYNISWWIWGKLEIILYHMWSLGVEEQFYLFWPACLFLLLRLFSPKKIQFGLFFTIIAIWLVKYILGRTILNDLIYESLFIGCLFALLRWSATFEMKISSSVIALFLVLLLIFGIFPIHSYFTVLYENNLRSVIGLVTMLIIIGLVQMPTGFISVVLSSPVLVAIGRISYALYLWHIPVFKWFSWHSGLPPSVAFVSKFIISFIMAGLSWYVIEKRSVAMGRRFGSISNLYLKDKK